MKPAPSWIALAPALFVVLWATGFVVARLSADHVEPLTFLSIRFPIAGILFLGIALYQSAAWPNMKQAMHAGVAGALLHGGYLGAIYWAVAHGMPAGVSALIVGLQPLMTAFLAAALLDEKISTRHWLGLAVGILGVGLVVWPKLTLDAVSGITPLTTALCILGALSVSLGTVYQKGFATGLHLASGGTWQYVGASLVVLIGAALSENFGFDGSFEAWFALGWSVIVLSLAAITLLMLLIRHGDVSRVSGLIYLVPAVAALMTYVFFGETLVPLQILGMAVCAGAVFIVTHKVS
ncbi:MAG TPA: EamA family transporter [Aestuariivirga sp.]|jgi:drug/metabolite transporter (DMT)-like permease|nr:EamA family transporter [Aestuariivirga sp.]